jgi:uncharacterized protein YcfJ
LVLLAEKKKDKEARVVGATIGGAAGGLIGAIVAGPAGAAIGSAAASWLGHEVAKEARKKGL